MNFWHFTYTKRHYLTHPWEAIGDFSRSLKYAFQRFYRGWDDTVIWSIDYYLSTMMPIWLRELKELKISTPILDDIHATPYNPDDPDNEEYWKIAHEVWDTYLTLMIEGFESAKKLVDSDLPIFEEAHAMVDYSQDILATLEPFGNAVDKLGGRERIKAERDALNDSYENGMKYFVKYFFSLWS